MEATRLQKTRNKRDRQSVSEHPGRNFSRERRRVSAGRCCTASCSPDLWPAENIRFASFNGKYTKADSGLLSSRSPTQRSRSCSQLPDAHRRAAVKFKMSSYSSEDDAFRSLNMFSMFYSEENVTSSDFMLLQMWQKLSNPEECQKINESPKNYSILI